MNHNHIPHAPHQGYKSRHSRELTRIYPYHLVKSKVTVRAPPLLLIPRSGLLLWKSLANLQQAKRISKMGRAVAST